MELHVQAQEELHAVETNLCISPVRGSISFFPSRGSKGVKAPNCKKRSFNQTSTQMSIVMLQTIKNLYTCIYTVTSFFIHLLCVLYTVRITLHGMLVSHGSIFPASSWSGDGPLVGRWTSNNVYS